MQGGHQLVDAFLRGGVAGGGNELCAGVVWVRECEGEGFRQRFGVEEEVVHTAVAEEVGAGYLFGDAEGVALGGELGGQEGVFAAFPLREDFP